MKNFESDLSPKICCFGLKILIEIACFACVCALCSLSSKDPFKSHVIGDLNQYFYGEENTSSLIINDTQKHKLLTLGFKDIPLESPNKNIYLRKLVSNSFCLDIQDKFVKYYDNKLSNIFDLNYDKIRKISISNMVISLVLFICIIIAGIIIKRNIDNLGTACFSWCCFCIISSKISIIFYFNLLY